LKKIKTPAYYILCDDDSLIQQRKTAERAKALLPNFKRATFFKGIGHAIEVAPAAYVEFAKILKEHFRK
jgi:pimeloyl-ACP methyl ester carboxylesterase